MGNSNTLRHGTYWKVKGETINSGYHIDSVHYSEEEATRSASLVLPEYEAQVELLDTLESDLAWDDSRFDETQIIPSKRWCVLVKFVCAM